LLFERLAFQMLDVLVSELTRLLSGQKGETNMKRGFANWNRTVAASMVLAALMVMSARQVLAAEPSGELTSKEVKALVAGAKTPADHMKLARHCTAMAVKHEAEAQEHEALAVEYAANPHMSSTKHPMGPKTAEHCKYYAEHCRNAAKEMRAMAAAHEEMAKTLTK
jgi:hypothetical protein